MFHKKYKATAELGRVKTVEKRKQFYYPVIKETTGYVYDHHKIDTMGWRTASNKRISKNIEHF